MAMAHRLRLCAATSFFAFGGAWSQDATAPAEPRTWFQLHGTAATWRLQTRGDDTAVYPDTPLQTETDLGLPRHHAITGLGFGRRIGQRWRIELDYESVRREGTAVLGSDVVAGGVVFAGGSTLRSAIGLRTLRVNAGWSLLMTEDSEAGIVLGGQWFEISRKFDGQGRQVYADPASAIGPQSSSSGDLAPVLLVGLFGSQALAPDWRLNARAEFGLGGGYRHGVVSAQWRALPNLALGVGYRYTRADLDVLFGFVACCSRLLVDYRTHGPAFTADLLLRTRA